MDGRECVRVGGREDLNACSGYPACWVCNHMYVRTLSAFKKLVPLIRGCVCGTGSKAAATQEPVNVSANREAPAVVRTVLA